MITREKLKTDAKSVLSNTYWMSFAVQFIVSTAVSAITSVVFAVVYVLTIVLQMAIAVPVALISQDETASVLAVLLSPGGLIIFGYVFALAVFVSFPAQAGLHYFYIKSRNTLKPDIGDTFMPFKTNYKNTVYVMFMAAIRIWLWSLLFTIPGIIKSLEYWMVSYIVAENPDISYKRALEISSKTMNGEKAFTFVLGLSFLGWIMLCMLTWGIGAMFLPPYMNATYTEYYMYLKDKAISNGYADPSEFTRDGAAAPVTATV